MLLQFHVAASVPPNSKQLAFGLRCGSDLRHRDFDRTSRPVKTRLQLWVKTVLTAQKPNFRST